MPCIIIPPAPPPGMPPPPGIIPCCCPGIPPGRRCCCCCCCCCCCRCPGGIPLPMPCSCVIGITSPRMSSSSDWVWLASCCCCCCCCCWALACCICRIRACCCCCCCIIIICCCCCWGLPGPPPMGFMLPPICCCCGFIGPPGPPPRPPPPPRPGIPPMPMPPRTSPTASPKLEPMFLCSVTEAQRDSAAAGGEEIRRPGEKGDEEGTGHERHQNNRRKEGISYYATYLLLHPASSGTPLLLHVVAYAHACRAHARRAPHASTCPLPAHAVARHPKHHSARPGPQPQVVQVQALAARQKIRREPVRKKREQNR